MLNKSIPTKFEQSDIDRLNYFSKLYDRPVSYLIREATKAYLDANAKKIEFLKEAELASIKYHQTNLHVNHKEITDWLIKLSNTEDEIKTPICHK